jgi:dynein heavy chain
VELKAIVRFLEKMDSNDARGFGELAENIKTKSEEAQNNLVFLESLFDPCKKLESAEPKEIPDMLPELLKRVRMIWHHSKFYNSNDRTTNLLNKISNQIIQRCKAKINVDDMLDGDV